VTYYTYRWYDPVTGRWPSRDPIGEYGAINLYRFGWNSPVYGIDCFGDIWHHLIPFAGGLDNGLDFDFINGKDNGKTLTKDDHDLLHERHWTKMWNDWFKGECKDGRKITKESALAQLDKMKNLPQFKEILDRGTPVDGPYREAMERLKKRQKLKKLPKGGGGKTIIVAGVASTFYTLITTANASDEVCCRMEDMGSDISDAIDEGEDVYDLATEFSAYAGDVFGLDEIAQRVIHQEILNYADAHRPK
jgi:hypothetical protein